MAVQDLNGMRRAGLAMAAWIITASMAVAADPVVRMSPAVRASAAAAPGEHADGNVFVYPAGCYDREGRPFNPDPASPSRSADPACQPPSGTVVQGRARGTGAPGEASMEAGSINRPPLPVPVPDGIGVMR